MYTRKAAKKYEKQTNFIYIVFFWWIDQWCGWSEDRPIGKALLSVSRLPWNLIGPFFLETFRESEKVRGLRNFRNSSVVPGVSIIPYMGIHLFFFLQPKALERIFLWSLIVQQKPKQKNNNNNKPPLACPESPGSLDLWIWLSFSCILSVDWRSSKRRNGGFSGQNIEKPASATGNKVTEHTNNDRQTEGQSNTQAALCRSSPPLPPNRLLLMNPSPASAGPQEENASVFFFFESIKSISKSLKSPTFGDDPFSGNPKRFFLPTSTTLHLSFPTMRT